MDSLERNSAIKEYIEALFVKEDAFLQFARKNSQVQKLPNIQVPSQLGKMLFLLTKIRAPKRVLEIGTLGAYSTLWIAKALPPGGRLISLEIDSRNVLLAKEHVARAGYENCIEIREGNALSLLASMVEGQEGPFDQIFIDADKKNYLSYLEFALALSVPGTLILSDNLIPKGEEINEDDSAIYQFNRKVAEHPRLESILAPIIVGDKGRLDALGISLVR